jgi:cytochrome c
MKAVSIVLALAALSAGSPALASPDLAKAKNCMACHKVDAKLVGPAYIDVAKKYAKDPAGEAKIVKQIREGGSGQWGAVPMPPQPQVSADEAKQLAKWIQSLGK